LQSYRQRKRSRLLGQLSKRINSEIYRAAEDSFLLADALEEQQYDNAVEIGVGEGFVTAALARRCKNVVGTDIDNNAIGKTRERLVREGLADRVNLMLCDGASPLLGKFDSCVFNPPYLPSDVDDITVAGGKEGIETTTKWFDQCIRVLKSDGSIIFVASSLSNLNSLLEYVRKKGFHAIILARQNLFFEEIVVIQAKR
jgi:release factor glutamine methyltransferase